MQSRTLYYVLRNTILIGTYKYTKICSTLSLNMSESKESSTLHELEMSELPQGSPDELTRDVPTPRKAAQGQLMCNIKRCMFLIILVISSTILVAEINAAKSQRPDLPVVENGDFTFRVYCPYFYQPRALQLQRESQSGQLRRRLYQRPSYTVELPYSQDQAYREYDFKNTYVIDMQSRNNNGTPLLYYCGYTRPFDSDCKTEVKYTCSSPGAMFDLDVSTYADIIWINNLSQEDALVSNCMTSPSSSNARCQLMVKSVNSKTFDDPTSHPKHQDMMIINGSQWPVTAHVHGAEVRPTFDGNPVSWFANNGARGVGAFSLNDTCYYSKFDQDDTEDRFVLPPDLIVKKDGQPENRTKVNRYPNIQNPGNLWYHDHAMRLTLYNVQYGLSGLYMLRNHSVQNQIGVHIQNEKLVMMTTDGWKTTQNLESASDVVYRFRFLNNNFDGGSVFKIEFKYGACENNPNVIPFTIIGADSSLFSKGIYDQTSFIIAQAERMEILIKFTENQKSYSICPTNAPSTFGPPNPPKASARAEHAATEHATLDEFSTQYIENIRIVSSIEFKTVDKNKRKDINNVTLPVPYVNFSNPNLSVSVKRMRPLMNTDVLTINARSDFHGGKSENPTIGTYEDWYLINTISNGHPIHVHLINFQVIKVLNLRFEKTNTCTLYELDFIVAAIILNGSSYLNNRNIFPNASDFRNVDYNYLCTIKKEIYKDKNFLPLLQKVNVEDVFENDISGIDVEKKRDDYDTKLFQRLGISTDKGDGKYVTNQEDPIKPYYGRWKDTAFVEGYKVFVYRIRWAKSSYAGGNDTPFHVPVDQLREYPGFVYHCHILGHEDKEMMRPIMLQLPKDVKLNPETTCNNITDSSGKKDYSWATKAACINDKCPA